MASAFHDPGRAPCPHTLRPAALLLWMLLSLLSAAAVPATALAKDTGKGNLEQARHYYKKGLLKEAQQEIKAVLATEEGRENAKAQLLAAQIYRDRGEIDLSFRAISKARQCGGRTEQESADELYRAMTRSFGEVRILPAGGVHVKGRIFLESTETFINVQRKALFQGVQRALLVKQGSYPDSIWIPYGEYKANGATFKHEQGGRTEVVVPFPQIAVLRSDSHQADKGTIHAFRSRTGGVTQIYNLEGDLEKGKLIAEKLRRKKVDLLVALGAKAAVLCRRELRRFPMVFGMIEDDWQSYDLRSSGQATGVALHPAPGTVLERFRRVAPSARRIGVLYDPARGEQRMKQLAVAFEEARCELVPAEVPAGASLAGVLAELRGRVDALWMMADPSLTTLEAFQLLLREEATTRKPLIAPSGDLVRGGALMAVEGDRRAIGIQMADQARQILFGGVSPSELEVSGPERVSWHLNSAVAAALGLTVSKTLRTDIDQLHEKLPESWRK